jgi:hypothetical protein
VHLDAENREALAVVKEFEGVVASETNGFVTVELDDLNRLPALVQRLVTQGVRLTRVEPVQPTLEQLYFEMQRHHRGEEAKS